MSTSDKKERRQRAQEADANLAVEDIHFTPEERRFLDELDAADLSPEEERERIAAYLARTREPAPAGE